MLCLSGIMVITTDQGTVCFLVPWAPCMAIIITITMTTFIFLNPWLCVSILEKVAAGRSDPRPGRSSSPPVRLSPAFAFSGSNLVVLIIKASASCCCGVNQEVKRAPKNSIFTQVDQHNKEHAVDRDRLLSCQIKWQRGWLLETDNKQPCWYVFCCGRPSKHARWGTLWHVWVSFHLYKHPQCARFEERLHFVFHLFWGHGVDWMLSIHIPHHYIPHLSWQTLWLHIIWVISLYFYAADVSPCQQAPWQSKMENPPLLKCCTWVSLLSFPPLGHHTNTNLPLRGDPMGRRPRVQSWWWENIF